MLAFEGDEGIGRFRTRFVDDGVEVAMDGVCTVAFDGDAAVEFEEWWHVETE